MKKFNKAIGLFALLSAFALMSLGSGSSSSEPKETKAITQNNNNSGTASAETEKVKEDKKEETKSEAIAITIEEQVLLDQNDLKITAKEYVEDSIWGPGVKVLIENNSDKNLGISCGALIVNNYMVSDLFSKTVAPGKKANENIYFLSADLKNAGIHTVGQIELFFHIFDGDTYSTIFDSDFVTIKTSAYDSMEVVKMDDGQELYNDGGIKIIGKYVDETSLWGTAVLLYIENTAGKNIVVQADDMSINGFIVTPYFSSTVYDGKMALDDITIMKSDLETNGITSVDEIELKFKILDPDSFQTIATTDAITFSAK